MDSCFDACFTTEKREDVCLISFQKSSIDSTYRSLSPVLFNSSEKSSVDKTWNACLLVKMKLIILVHVSIMGGHHHKLDFPSEDGI